MLLTIFVNQLGSLFATLVFHQQLPSVLGIRDADLIVMSLIDEQGLSVKEIRYRYVRTQLGEVVGLEANICV